MLTTGKLIKLVHDKLEILAKSAENYCELLLLLFQVHQSAEEPRY